MSVPLVSVIMPVFNGGKFLEEAIQSILSQTFKDFEFIIINDGSTDNSLAIMKRYSSIDSRIKIIDRSNRGLIFSLNEGISVSRGQFIARMDADDISFPQRFEKQIEHMTKDASDVCGCHYLAISEQGDKEFEVYVPTCPELFFLFLSFGVPFAHGSVMMRKVFLQLNDIWYGDSHQYAEDKALWYRLFDKGAKFSNVDQILFAYRQVAISKSRKQKKEIRQDDRAIRFQYMRKYRSHAVSVMEALESRFASLSEREKGLVIELAFELKLNRVTLFKNTKKKLLIYTFLKYLYRCYF
jgi:glycosyltransferase involved in cell wall biosynthesis